MNLAETDQLLTLMSNLDNRKVDDATVLAWHEILHDLPFEDCRDAVTEHYTTSGDWLMPVHIVRGARELERKRIRAANEARAIAEAPATDPRPLTDRSAEIRAEVDKVRSVLPEGDPDSLRYGTKYWRRNRARIERQQRQENPEPNPLYDPAALARLAQMTPPSEQETP